MTTAQRAPSTHTRPLPHQTKHMHGRIPVTVLTGFLGSGKTTLLNHWMQQQDMEGVAVLVNEFGEVGIDHHLVENAQENMVLLDSGCLCCETRGDLVAALRSLSERAARREIAPLTRIIVETSGLADPVPIVYTLMDERFSSARFLCDGVTAVISATHAQEQLRQNPETLRQIIAADYLLVSKADLANSTQIATLTAQLHALNPNAQQRLIRHGRASLEELTGIGLYAEPEKFMTNSQIWLGANPIFSNKLTAQKPNQEEVTSTAAHASVHLQRILGSSPAAHTHTQNVTSFIVALPKKIQWFGLSFELGKILKEYGPNLLRIKGMIGPHDGSAPLVVHCVQDIAYPPVRLAAWPEDGTFSDQHSRLIIIAQSLSTSEQENIQHRLSNSPDDRAALRMAAAIPDLPTRCWMQQRIAIQQASNRFQHDGWRITSHY